MLKNKESGDPKELGKFQDKLVQVNMENDGLNKAYEGKVADLKTLENKIQILKKELGKAVHRDDD